MDSSTTLLKPLPLDDSVLILARDLPAYIGVSEQTLARWRHEGQGPAYLKLGARMVAYTAADVRAWLSGGKRHSGRQFGRVKPAAD